MVVLSTSFHSKAVQDEYFIIAQMTKNIAQTGE